MDQRGQEQPKTASAWRDMRVRVAALVFFCFLLGSTGWIAWLYHIARLADAAMVDLYTMVFGYLAQAIGIGAYMIVRWRAGATPAMYATMASIAAYVILLEPALVSDSIVATLVFGYAMNAMCGFAQGHYLSCLAESVEPNYRGIVFGGSYAATTIATWLFSIIGVGIETGASTIVLCLFLACFALPCARFAMPQSAAPSEHDAAGEEPPRAHPSMPKRSVFWLVACAIVVMSLVKNAGFSFPTTDLSTVVNLELSRLFYGVGLVMAGIAADRDRRLALACCAVSLVTPFLLLALSNAGASGIVTWALGYLLFGFFSVYRVVVFADLSDQSGRIWLAGAGLLLGRVGDALGTVLCLAFAESAVLLVSVTGALFVVASALLILVYARLYIGKAGAGAKEAEAPDPIDGFCARFDLSEREREVLELLVGKMTNVRIADELCISEATVKYHVRNILKKTGCANRGEIIALYRETG